jgi:putative ABC transport system permease protein
LAIAELRSSAARSRALAIAATGATAVFGSVTIQAAHANLQAGLDRVTTEVSSVADLWVAPLQEHDLLTTTPFPLAAVKGLANLPGVQAVGDYRAGFLDLGNRRTWVLAPPPTAKHLVPPSQILDTSISRAEAKIRAGGWMILSRPIAEQYHLHVGDSFTLPTRSPVPLRVAALSTNIGWSPGAVIMNTNDYSRLWNSSDIGAYNVLLRPGASAASVKREIQQRLGQNSALGVETAAQRNARQRAISRQGLARLTQISILVLTAAVMAMAAAMGAMIWQRRPRLANLKLDGLTNGQVWRALLFESTLLLGAGCMAGALAGLYGEFFMSKALVAIMGYPIVFSLGLPIALGSFALVTVVAVAVVASPGYLVARVTPAIGLQE